MSTRPAVIYHSETVNPYMTTDAAFRAIGLAFHACLEAIGWTQTEDTGQVDWATVTIPAASTPSTIYEVWRSGDDANLSESRPLYLRLTYGRSSAPTNIPTIWAAVGTATNGNGTLASAADTNVSYVAASCGIVGMGPAVTNANGLLEIVGHSGGFFLSTWANQGGVNTRGGMLHVERHLNSDGSPTQYGFVFESYGQITYSTSTATMKAQCFRYNNAYPQPSISGAGLALTGSTAWGGVASQSSLIDNIASVFPVLTGFMPMMGAPSLLCVAVNSTDVACPTEFQTTHYGATRLFKSVAPGSSSVFNGDSQVAGYVPAMRIASDA